MLLQQASEIARRSILQTIRQPAMVIPPILFPLILMGINVGGLAQATNIPGFPPVDSYLDFAIAFPFIQGSLFASINAGSSIARDIETGFLNRLALTPMQRADMRVAAVFATDTARQCAEWAHLVAGTSAIREGTRLERAFRDIYTGTQHAFISEKVAMDAAQIWLDLIEDHPGL